MTRDGTEAQANRMAATLLSDWRETKPANEREYETLHRMISYAYKSGHLAGHEAGWDAANKAHAALSEKLAGALGGGGDTA